MNYEEYARIRTGSDSYMKDDHYGKEDDQYDIEDNPPDEEEEDEETDQEHVHEYTGSTMLAECGEDVHNHRFTSLTGEAIAMPEGHIHKLLTRSDFFDHFHSISKYTGLQIPVSDVRHVHYVKGLTTYDNGHKHEFQFATQIECPTLPDPEDE